MRATVENDYITVDNPTSDFEQYITEALSYTDKAVQYRLRRMAKSPFARNSPMFKKLQGEQGGCLIKSSTGTQLVVPSGFLHLVSNAMSSTTDNRRETGKKIALPWANKPFSPRDYQEEALQLMASNWRGVINLATGLGKTLIATHAIQRFKKKALVVCPTDSIARQFYNELVSAFGSHRVGFYGGGKKKINDITVGIAKSVSNDIAKFAAADLGLVVMDECHHTPANTFYQISEGLAHVGRMYGLTATDFRSDGKDVLITAACGDVLIRRDIVWGVAHGWLAQPYFIVRNVDTTTEPDFRDDKLRNYKAHVLNCKTMKDQIRNDIDKFMKAGKSVLCLVDEVAHGMEIAQQLGIPFATGKDKQSQEYVDQLNAGTITGLVGTDGKVGEGTDTKRVDVLVLANFVASRGPVIQAVGRGLRIYPGKSVCYILDYVPIGSDMLSRHALGRVKLYREITDKVKLL